MDLIRITLPAQELSFLTKSITHSKLAATVGALETVVTFMEEEDKVISDQDAQADDVQIEKASEEKAENDLKMQRDSAPRENVIQTEEKQGEISSLIGYEDETVLQDNAHGIEETRVDIDETAICDGPGRQGQASPGVDMEVVVYDADSQCDSFKSGSDVLVEDENEVYDEDWKGEGALKPGQLIENEKEASYREDSDDSDDMDEDLDYSLVAGDFDPPLYSVRITLV